MLDSIISGFLKYLPPPPQHPMALAEAAGIDPLHIHKMVPDTKSRACFVSLSAPYCKYQFCKRMNDDHSPFKPANCDFTDGADSTRGTLIRTPAKKEQWQGHVLPDNLPRGVPGILMVAHQSTTT